MKGDGKVGIGATNPGEKLEVVGNVFANVSNAGGFMLTASSNSGLVRYNATDIALRTNSTDQLIVDLAPLSLKYLCYRLNYPLRR